MSFDIYGNKLRPGHCEVHPDVSDVYPCWYCRAGQEPEECCRSGPHVPSVEHCLPPVRLARLDEPAANAALVVARRVRR